MKIGMEFWKQPGFPDDIQLLGMKGGPLAKVPLQIPVCVEWCVELAPRPGQPHTEEMEPHS